MSMLFLFDYLTNIQLILLYPNISFATYYLKFWYSLAFPLDVSIHLTIKLWFMWFFTSTIFVIVFAIWTVSRARFGCRRCRGWWWRRWCSGVHSSSCICSIHFYWLRYHGWWMRKNENDNINDWRALYGEGGVPDNSKIAVNKQKTKGHHLLK